MAIFTAGWGESTGKAAGAEVAQLYVHEENTHLMRPEKELKGFKNILLPAGGKQTVSIPLTRGAFSANQWAHSCQFAPKIFAPWRLCVELRHLTVEA